MRTRGLRIAALMLSVLAIDCDGPTAPNEAHLEIVQAFADSTKNGETDLVLRSADGTTSRPLVSLAGLEAYPKWSPDGAEVVFNRSDGRPWMVSADGSNLRPLLAGQGLYVDWSPDGKFIAFERGGATGREIAVARSDGSDVRSLTGGIVGAAFGPPSWSPDGRIAFLASGGIWTVRSDGTGLAMLVPDYSPTWLRWSPDGSRLAFLSYIDVGLENSVRQVVFVVNADGSGRRQLTTGANYSTDLYPSWSPDGEWVLFERAGGGPGLPGCRLYKIPAAGGPEVLLATQTVAGQCLGASWRR